MRTMVRILLLSLVILPLSAGEEGSDSPGELATLQHIDSLEPELLNGIGTSHLRISTDSAVAQKYFNQASSLLHCFREFESLRASRKVLRLDPDAAMADARKNADSNLLEVRHAEDYLNRNIGTGN